LVVLRGNFLSTNQKHYQDLGSARHQYGISALVTQTSFCGGSSGDFEKNRLFSQAKLLQVVIELQKHTSSALGLFKHFSHALLNCNLLIQFKNAVLIFLFPIPHQQLRPFQLFLKLQ